MKTVLQYLIDENIIEDFAISEGAVAIKLTPESEFVMIEV